MYWEKAASANHFPKADAMTKQTGLLWKTQAWAFGTFEQQGKKKNPQWLVLFHEPRSLWPLVTTSHLSKRWKINSLPWKIPSDFFRLSIREEFRPGRRPVPFPLTYRAQWKKHLFIKKKEARKKRGGQGKEFQTTSKCCWSLSALWVIKLYEGARRMQNSGVERSSK